MMGFIDSLKRIGGRFPIQVNRDACWQRLFGTRSPKGWLPDPIKTYKPAWAQTALQQAKRR